MDERWRLRVMLLVMLVFVALILLISVTVSATAALAADLELLVGLGEMASGTTADGRTSVDALLERPGSFVRPT